MEHEKGKIVPFRRDVMNQDTLIRSKTLIAKTKHGSADEIRKKAREAERKQRLEQLTERRRIAAEQKKRLAEERKLQARKQRRLELLMFLILLLIVILFFVIDAVIGTASDGSLHQMAPDPDAVLMQMHRIL